MKIVDRILVNMKTIDKVFLVVGMLVPGFIIWYSNYSDVHWKMPAGRNMDLLYLVLWPSSLALMAADAASKSLQVVYVVLAVIVNGWTYAGASIAVRAALTKEIKPEEKGR